MATFFQSFPLAVCKSLIENALRKFFEATGMVDVIDICTDDACWVPTEDGEQFIQCRADMDGCKNESYNGVHPYLLVWDIDMAEFVSLMREDQEQPEAADEEE